MKKKFFKGKKNYTPSLCKLDTRQGTPLTLGQAVCNSALASLPACTEPEGQQEMNVQSSQAFSEHVSHS